MDAKCTRIWWVRPVTGTQAARLRPFCTFNMVYSVRLGLPSGVTHRPMMLSPRRPMGASITPGPKGSSPSTMA